MISFDPRGHSRSRLDGPPEDQRAGVHGDDASQLLARLTTEAAFIFGSSSGAAAGLDLAARHPDQVRLLVAHEPPAEVAAMTGRMNATIDRMRANMGFFLAHELRQFSSFVPDIGALQSIADRVMLAVGRDSRALLTGRPAGVLAECLGSEIAEFPGGHGGYATDPADFAVRLADVLAGAFSSGGSK